jgi:hypothetical protein
MSRSACNILQENDLTDQLLIMHHITSLPMQRLYFLILEIFLY